MTHRKKMGPMNWKIVVYMLCASVLTGIIAHVVMEFFGVRHSSSLGHAISVFAITSALVGAWGHGSVLFNKKKDHPKDGGD